MLKRATRGAAAEPPFTLKPVGPGAWAAISNPRAKEPAGANPGFLIGDDGAAVIDTFASTEAASQLLAEIRTLTKLPVKFVINTHYHPDHVAGNAIFVTAGAVVLAQRNVRRWIHTENLKFFGREIKPEQKAFIEALAAPTVVYEQAVDLYLGSPELRWAGERRDGGGQLRLSVSGTRETRPPAPLNRSRNPSPWPQ